MFAKVQHEQALRQVRKQVNLTSILPKIAKSKYFPQATLSDEVPVTNNLVIYSEVTFNQKLKAKLVTIKSSSKPWRRRLENL